MQKIFAVIAVEMHGVGSKNITVTGDVHWIIRFDPVFVGQCDQSFATQFELGAPFLRMLDDMSLTYQRDLCAIVTRDALLSLGIHVSTTVIQRKDAYFFNLKVFCRREMLRFLASDFARELPCSVEGLDGKVAESVIGILAHGPVGLWGIQGGDASEQPPAPGCQQGYNDQGEINAQGIQQAAQFHADGPVWALTPTCANSLA